MQRFAALVLIAFTAVACGSGASGPQALPPGDASRGAALFTQSVNGAPPCANCHTTDGTTLIGPSLHGLGVAAGTRIANTSAQDYVSQSIISPAAYLISGYGNLMYNGYAQRLTPQQIADLTAYLLTL